jgi:hypothetical protein
MIYPLRVTIFWITGKNGRYPTHYEIKMSLIDIDSIKYKNEKILNDPVYYFQINYNNRGYF